MYLSDFGLGKQTLNELGQTGLTAQGQFLGTLDYMAPEQVEGRPVDGRADLYALACAAFELLSGAPPFRRGAGMAVVWAKLSESPPLLSTRRTDLPGGGRRRHEPGDGKGAGRPLPQLRGVRRGTARRVRARPGGAAPPARPPRQATQIAMPIRPPAAERPRV